MYNVGLDKFGKKAKQQPEEVAKKPYKEKTKCDYHWGKDCNMWQKNWENQIKGLTFSWVKEEYQRKAKYYNMDRQRRKRSKQEQDLQPTYSNLHQNFRQWIVRNV